jgi:hypothetical protein
MLPNRLGAAPLKAIDSEVWAVGRMVVWVDAAAEVSTAITSSLSSGEPSTAVPSKASTSSEFSTSVSGPAKAWAANETIT